MTWSSSSFRSPWRSWGKWSWTFLLQVRSPQSDINTNLLTLNMLSYYLVPGAVHCVWDSLCSWLFSGKLEELPRKPLGQELPLLLSPVQSSRGKPSSASGIPRAGLSLHIISHQTDSISPDQSPSKDPRDLDAAEEDEAPLPSPDPIIIHSQAPLTPDGSPLMGPPPYQPPGSQTVDQLPLSDNAVVTTSPRPAPQIADALLSTSTDDLSSVVSTDQSSCRVPRTCSAPAIQVASPGSGTGSTRTEGLSAAEVAEDRYLIQLLEQASALCTDKNLNQDSSTALEETQAADVSWNKQIISLLMMFSLHFMDYASVDDGTPWFISQIISVKQYLLRNVAPASIWISEIQFVSFKM